MTRWAAALLLIPSIAVGAEIQVDGAYQARARLADTLSLNRQIEESEGFSWYMDHRLWIRPKIWISQDVGVFADILALDNVRWGQQQVPYEDPLTGEPIQLVFSDDVRSPLEDGEIESTRVDLTLWRAWAEAHTKIGTFKIGRQPLHWGLGIWQNAGTGINQEYGDTADRVSWELLIQDIWLRAAFDIHTDGLVNQTDEIWAFNAAIGYSTERLFGGLQYQYRRSNVSGATFDLHTFDAALDLEFGPLDVDGEFVFQLGNGDLEGGLDDVSLFTGGGALRLGYEIDRFQVNAEFGYATGDGDPNDTTINQFTFDRDYNVGFLMFEQPMPVLQSSIPGEARSGQVVQLGNAISNTFYLRPSASIRALPGFFVDAQVMAAFSAYLPQEANDADRAGLYGVETDIGLRYEALDRLELVGTLGIFAPGNYFTNFADDTFSGFSETAVGGQFIVRARF